MRRMRRLEKTSPLGTCFFQKWKNKSPGACFFQKWKNKSPGDLFFPEVEKQVPRGLGLYSTCPRLEIQVSAFMSVRNAKASRIPEPFLSAPFRQLHPQWRSGSSAPQWRPYIN